jgi:hypothetical protein
MRGDWRKKSALQQNTIFVFAWDVVDMLQYRVLCIQFNSEEQNSLAKLIVFKAHLAMVCLAFQVVAYE